MSFKITNKENYIYKWSRNDKDLSSIIRKAWCTEIHLNTSGEKMSDNGVPIAEIC